MLFHTNYLFDFLSLKMIKPKFKDGHKKKSSSHEIGDAALLPISKFLSIKGRSIVLEFKTGLQEFSDDNNINFNRLKSKLRK